MSDQYWGEADAYFGRLRNWVEGETSDSSLLTECPTGMWAKLCDPDIFDGASMRQRQDVTARQRLGDMLNRNEIDQACYMTALSMSAELELNEEQCLSFVKKAQASKGAVARLERIKGHKAGHYAALSKAASDGVGVGVRVSAYEGFFWEQESVLRTLYLLFYERHKKFDVSAGSKTGHAIRATHSLLEQGLLSNVIIILDRRLDDLAANATNRAMGFWARDHHSESRLMLAEVLFLATQELQCTEREARKLILLINKLSNILVEHASGTILSASGGGVFMAQEQSHAAGQTHPPVLWYKGAQLLLFRLQFALASMLEPKFEEPFDRGATLHARYRS
jgi:hypothetical protein